MPPSTSTTRRPTYRSFNNNRIPLRCHGCGVASKTQRFSEHPRQTPFRCYHLGGCCPESVVKSPWKAEFGEAHAEDDGEVVWAVFLRVDLKIFENGSTKAAGPAPEESRRPATQANRPPPTRNERRPASKVITPPGEERRPAQEVTRAATQADRTTKSGEERTEGSHGCSKSTSRTEEKAAKAKRKSERAAAKARAKVQKTMKIKLEEVAAAEAQAKKTKKSKKSKQRDLELEASLTCEEVVRRRFQRAKEKGEVIVLDIDDSESSSNDDDSLSSSDDESSSSTSSESDSSVPDNHHDSDGSDNNNYYKRAGLVLQYSCGKRKVMH